MSTSPKKYDVFISFRGEDTRETFTSHLHYAFCKESIAAYIDDYLIKGDEIGPALAQAIQDSHISVVVFSENYASSKWCLSELLKILECRKLHGQVVIPVFHNTDPSHVRHQTGSYGEVFTKYEREVMNNESFAYTVSQWKGALAEAANIPGWHSSSRTYKDDSQVIQSIVKDVWQKLALMYPNELKGIVHTYGTSENVESLLQRCSRIGIWGMGGIGKTTIARQMFAKHFAHFDSACFLESVSEGSKKFGLQYLRDKLLGDLLKQPITASDVHGLHTFIRRRLSGRKVFIVLDDVDNAAQLDYLCAELDELGPNSWLIITTRDRQIFGKRVAVIYKVEQWAFKKSLRLFSLGAFKQSQPKEGYQLLSQRAVAYAGGVPLALKVLGAHFYSRNTEFWEAELKYLENKGESLRGIQQVLEVSYNGITVLEREMFLDIAFFFKGENRYFTTTVLDACGFNATSGIDILEDKALITFSNNNIIQMHDLLQKMAFDIVRNKNDRALRDPRKRSRLRDIEEVCDVLNNSRGTHKVEGIIFDLSQKADLHFRADTFNMMTKLRFLRLSVPLGKERLATIYHPKDMLPFSDKLRYLEWNGYPLKSLPHPFCAKHLVEIHFPHSNVKYLWHGMQELVNLEGMNLNESKQLVKLPDLSGATKLKWLYLSGCENLCEVQPSVFSKDTLVILLVDRCKKLESLVSEKHLTLLEKIVVNGCSSLKEFSVSSDSFEELDLSNTGINILHSSIGRLSNIMWLNLKGLRLTNLPKELSCLRSLTKLHLSNCNIVTKSKLEDLFDGLESLSKLYLEYCCKLCELPENISSLSSLYELRLDGCSVKMLPASIKNLLNLEILSIDDCRELGCLPELPPHIKQFHADNCISLVTVSTLKTFSASMKGTQKHISFKNGMRMRLDDRIMEDVVLTMKSAAFHNTLVRYNYDTHGYNYNQAHVCLPGSRVPRQFKFRTTDSSCITIEIPHLSRSLGFIFSAVVSPLYGMEEHGNGAIIECQSYSEGQSRISGNASMWGYGAITDLSSDHVFVWYDPYNCDNILCNNEAKILEFSVTTVTGECNDFYSMKECGVCPIYFSEFPRFVATMNLDKDLEERMALELSRELGSDLNDAIQFESDTIERYDEREGNDIESIERCDEEKSTGLYTQMQSQDFDLNKKCGCSYDCVIGPLSYLWRLICT